MPAAASTGPSQRKDIVAYLRAQTPPLQAAFDAQRKWVQQLPALYAANKGPATAERARAMGKQYSQIFRGCLQQAEALQPPVAAVRCQEYLIRWLNCLINAAGALMNAPSDGQDAGYLRDCRDYLDDARYAVKPLTEIRHRLYEATKAAPTRPAGAATTR